MATNAPPGAPLDALPQGPPGEVPDSWVPVDERVLGFDRKTIWPGVVLLVVWALWAHVMPWINDRVSDVNPIKLGDVINLSQGELTFVPAVGWNLESGLLLTPDSAEKVSVPSTASVSTELVLYSVQTGNWDQSADELIDQMIDIDKDLGRLVVDKSGGRADITNADGVPGRLAYIVGPDTAVLFAVYVFQTEAADGSKGPSVGVEIEARGQVTDIQKLAPEIAGMIDSTTYDADGVTP